MRLLIAALMIMSVSCSQSQSPTDPAAASVFTLRFGETAVVDGARVSFTDINDSRCPKTVACAWAGDAAVRLQSGSESVVLHTNPTAGLASARLGTLTTTLVEVKPEPVAPGEPKKSDYVITLRIAD